MSERTSGQKARLIAFCFFAALFSPRAESADATPGSDRRADLTSDYLDLHFSGSVVATDTAGACVYTIAPFDVLFLKHKDRLTQTISIEQFRVAVFDAHEKMLLENRDPLLVMLPAPEFAIEIPKIEFKIPKDILKRADYIALAVTGRATLRDDGRYAALDPAARADLLGGKKPEAWPITASSNIVRRETAGADEAERIIWRTPANAKDLCSTARIKWPDSAAK